MGVIALFVLSKLVADAAIFSARWPQPIKGAAIGMMLLAAGLCVWGVSLVVRLVIRLRLRGLLALLFVAYVVGVVILLLTTVSQLPAHQQVITASGTLLRIAGAEAKAYAGWLFEVPSAFRFAYTGRRPALSDPDRFWPGEDYLTPIPANY
jgi:hypothetical protein